jgi:hypothetical protein
MCRIVTILTFAAVIMSGCLQVQPQPPIPPATMSSWGPLGGMTVSSGATCAGRATLLNDGTASISDSCFTGDDNIVMCTDTTGVNPVKCAPAYGNLSISGTAGDTIAYVRLR